MNYFAPESNKSQYYWVSKRYGIWIIIDSEGFVVSSDTYPTKRAALDVVKVLNKGL